MNLIFRQCPLLFFLLFGAYAVAEETFTLAVASNFSLTAKALVAEFEKQEGTRIRLVPGSSGKLYAQIMQGAPFDVFLSADTDKPSRLIEDGRAKQSSCITYAIGQLVLWSPEVKGEQDLSLQLKTGKFTRLALANPRLAPYGVASMEVLSALGLVSAVEPKLVTGENVAQTLQFVASGNVPLGFIALSQWLQVQSNRGQLAGSIWLVPPSLYSPIQQGAVLLKRAEDNQAANKFMAFLQSPAAVKLMAEQGYAAP